MALSRELRAPYTRQWLSIMVAAFEAGGEAASRAADPTVRKNKKQRTS